MAKLGEIVLANGYPVTPIPVGGKWPGIVNWQNIHPTPAMVRNWVGNGHAHAGVGIISATVPAVDLDILESDLARHMQQWVIRHIGYAPVRIGQYPKRLLAFKSDDPFSKV
ncbi:bifunctional DNA primase/polymerase [Paeniroseomonas aquatica]|uniref:Bifunctional DNA primase/polymerase n=1 Tax=Paeniroseomonas aquatica TaxID=373043 RepID=A0ABT8AF79_9PROT|nr:bifunctional DNA primase/polymerase [Paeniroseomonas aquatica]MDN3568004.1 bifunctional DNA primase/polymerase [Paeniroseomonas aquatica]